MTDRTPRDHAAGESQQLSDVPPHETIRLRDMLIDELIAVRAMQGLLSNPEESGCTEGWYAMKAVRFADALLEELAK